MISITPVGEFNALEILEIDPEGGNNRRVMSPLDDYEDQPDDVIAAHEEFHTAEIVDAYRTFLAEQEGLFGADEGPRRIGTPREFLHLFTDQEKAAFFAAKRESVALELWWAEASTGDFSLDHPSVASGLGSLVHAQILTQERADEILAADFNAPLDGEQEEVEPTGARENSETEATPQEVKDHD